jgi:hypothetical protein
MLKAGMTLVAVTHFDRGLNQVVHPYEGNRWLKSGLHVPFGCPKGWYFEASTRFLLLATGRYRSQSLEVANRLQDAQVQLIAAGSLHYALQFEACEVTGVPPFNSDDRTTVVDQVFFDAGAQVLPPDGDLGRVDVAAALVHPHGLRDHYECRFRFRHLLARGGADTAWSLAMCGAIARRQLEWEHRFGASFFAFQRVQDYAVRAPDPNAPPKVLRAYGKHSRVVRSTKIMELYEGLEILAYAWDAYYLQPADATALVFGANRLFACLADASRTIMGLRAAVEERLLIDKRLASSEADRILRAIDLCEVHRLREDLMRCLEGSPEWPGSPVEGIRPTPVMVVQGLIYQVMDPEALRRVVRSCEATAAGYSPGHEKRLIRQVRDALGYRADSANVSDECADRERDTSLREPRPAGRYDTRLAPLIARKLAQRFKMKASIVLRFLVSPTFEHEFTGGLVEADERTVRNKCRPNRSS